MISKNTEIKQINTDTRNPLVSVIIGNYNYGRFIAEAIESVLSQTYENFELIVVDDGSTDKTLTWLTENKIQLPHVKVLEQNHQGAASARNLGVINAQGDTIIFIDSDLVVTENFLQCHA
ncbi:MAG: glycosyltransferase family 2 protein, partial [Cyanobacteria bacterium J06641_2]